MKIQFHNHTIARGEAHRESPINFRVHSQNLVDSIHLIGSKSARPIDRGNRHHELDFEVVRKHPSPEKALQHALLHTSHLQGLEGKFRATSEETNINIILNHAVLKSVHITVNGPLTIDQYQILGGDFSFDFGDKDL